MTKYSRRASIVFAALIGGAVVVLALLRSHPVLVRIPPDDSMSPRYYCVVNPFRDKGPEVVAATYLNRLSLGQSDAVSCCVGESKYVLEKEKQWPITHWRLGNRTDTADATHLIYWVERGNGYPGDGYESEVHFSITKAGSSWQVKSFSAVY